MDRRRFMLGSSSALGASMLLPSRLIAAASEDLPTGAIASAIMDALPGKRPLIKRTFRPPNYETPIALFHHAITPNNAFYMRWHMGVPDVAACSPRMFRVCSGVTARWATRCCAVCA
jgi:hypothetical protein